MMVAPFRDGIYRGTHAREPTFWGFLPHSGVHARRRRDQRGHPGVVKERVAIVLDKMLIGRVQTVKRERTRRISRCSDARSQVSAQALGKVLVLKKYFIHRRFLGLRLVREMFLFCSKAIGVDAHTDAFPLGMVVPSFSAVDKHAKVPLQPTRFG